MSLRRDRKSETTAQAIWIGGVTFFGLGALILEDQ